MNGFFIISTCMPIFIVLQENTKIKLSLLAIQVACCIIGIYIGFGGGKNEK